jgi:hypothetical protein
MLKVWHEKVEKDKDNDVQTDIAECLSVISSLSTEEGKDKSEMNPAISPALQRKESVDDVHISPELTSDERKQLKEHMVEYDDIFSDVPQVTNIIEQKVVTRTEEPVYKQAFSIPYALRDKVKKEINDMLKAGIVEPSDSLHAAPIVLIKNKRSISPHMLRFP